MVYEILACFPLGFLSRKPITIDFENGFLFKKAFLDRNLRLTVKDQYNNTRTMNFSLKLLVSNDALYRHVGSNPQTTFRRYIASFGICGTDLKKAAVFC